MTLLNRATTLELSPLYFAGAGLDANAQAFCLAQPKEKDTSMKTNSVKSFALAAACAGLFGGTSARLNAQPTTAVSNNAPVAGVVLVKQDAPAAPKHSCKGKNDCKGQGG